MTTSTRPAAELKDRLLSARNADGGWGYYTGKASRLEPTCWALLALGEEVSADALRRWPAAEGLLLERRDGQPNFGFHGLSLITLLYKKVEHEAGIRALVRGIEQVKGRALPDQTVSRQNNSIEAWPWIADTASWVEPTTYCLLALKKAGRAGIPVDSRRIADGEALLLDRCGLNGGWNYGNSNVLGQELASYVPTTALGVLSMQDQASHDVIRKSRDYLEREALSERSSFALSLAAVALRVLGRPADAVTDALFAQLPTTLALGNLHVVALALFALRTDHDDAAFTL